MNYQFSPAVLNAMAEAERVRSQSQKTDEAIKSNASEAKLVGEALKTAREELAQLDAAIAIETNEKEGASLTKKITASAKAVTEKNERLERLERSGRALKSKAIELDLDVAKARVQLDASISEFVADFQKQISVELIEATAPLVSFMKRVGAINAALNATDVSLFLVDVVIPSLPSVAFPLIGQGKVTLADGAVSDLSAFWRNDSEMVAIFEALRKPREMLRSIAAHTPFEQRFATSTPYVRRGSYRGTDRTSGIGRDDSVASSRRAIPLEGNSISAMAAAEGWMPV